MTKEKPFSREQLAAILDNAPTAIYVTAVDDYELLYVNRMAEEILSWDAFRPGVKCYEVSGYDAPCPFCQVSKMNDRDLLVRDFHRPADKRIYQISGKVIDWAGRRAHIEFIMDVTDKRQKEEREEALKRDLQSTFSSIPCGLCVYRFDGEKILPLYHNPAFYRIMGYSADHIRSVEQETGFLGVHPDDMDELKAKIRTAIRDNGFVSHVYRLYNDALSEFCWIRVEGSVKSQEDGTKILYAVYSDVSEKQRLERELTATNEKMQDIVNAIPGGVAIYKVSDILKTEYFSDGVPELTGYTSEEYEKLNENDASELIYKEDKPLVLAKIAEMIATDTVADLEFRKLHRDGHIVWVHAQAKRIGDANGCPLIQCVFHNITNLKETQLELNHLVNSIPGGIASFKVEGLSFAPIFVSDGVKTLFGNAWDGCDLIGTIYEPDRERVIAAVDAALISGETLDVSYRLQRKTDLVWIHLNGRRMGPYAEVMRFYAVFTGMSAETKLFQDIANETADGIYVIDKENYELLYSNERRSMFSGGPHLTGQKCYETLHGRSSPCEFCTLKTHAADGEEHDIRIADDRYYTARFIETDWNGIPAYVQYIRDATEEVKTRREKERLEIYFQNLIKNLPGGVSVIRCEPDGRMTPEYISEGFAALTRTTVAAAAEMYKDDVFAGVFPEDVAANRNKLLKYLESGEGHCELTARMKCGDGGYVWVKSTTSLSESKDGVRRLYSSYTDVTKNIEEKELLRSRYEDILLQHYRIQGPDILVLGHCNVTGNRILEIDDHTDSNLLAAFGDVREPFFTGLSSLIVSEDERSEFLQKYLNEPALAAFKRNETEQIMECFVRFPKEQKGRYVRFKVNLVEAPDSGDITGILTVRDITEQTISDRIMHRLSVTSYDYIVDLNIDTDSYAVLAYNNTAHYVPTKNGSHSARVRLMSGGPIVPKDKRRYASALDPEEIRRRLTTEGSYTFSYSLIDETGDVRTKNMTVSAVDLRLGRVCLVCTDITESVREQQGLLNMIAYTFEIACFIDVGTARLTMYTRDTVLKSLPPYIIEDYNLKVDSFAGNCGEGAERIEAETQFKLETMLRRLQETPAGYDFVFPYDTGGARRYKQANVLWGDLNHRTVCVVRADVTDMLLAERRAKLTLEKALASAEEANRAKSDFLSSMSHDIRTPMNAIMGMTTIATEHLNEKDKVADCLKKISVSSRHLLSLINDVLDMSKLDRAKLKLNRNVISVHSLADQLSSIIEPQAKAAELSFKTRVAGLTHETFYGDQLRLNQILINLLSNAVKFTPAGGKVEFLIEELKPGVKEKIRYRFTIRDSGIGMPAQFMARMFDPFARGSEATGVEGTGLGLSITKGLVDLMAGTISAESEVGRGSVFRVEVDFEPAESKIYDEIASQSGVGADKDQIFAGRVFLVAEDNEINAEILCELLAMRGAKTVVRTDGAQAVEAFKSAAPGTYDGILMDIIMPEMNGYQAAGAIRRLDRPDAASIPIVAMTANAFAEDVQAALAAGMNAHVAKPIDLPTLYSVLKKFLPA